MTTPVYTLDEAADKLRKTPRWLADWLRSNPVDATGTPFYTPAGRTKTFDDSEIFRIRAALREAERCRLNSLRPATRKRKTSISAARTSESELTELRGLTIPVSRGASSNSSKDRSSEANIHRVNFREAKSRHS
jgi:hypothetical protein